MLNFDTLEMKYGSSVAYDLLLQIERASQLPSWKMTEIDHETRLANAIYAQDAVCQTAAMVGA